MNYKCLINIYVIILINVSNLCTFKPISKEIFFEFLTNSLISIQYKKGTFFLSQKIIIIAKFKNIQSKNMDVFDYFSEQEGDQQQQIQSDGVNNTNSTDLDRNSTLSKTKNIKKKYEPIQDGGKVYRYEDDPVQYKKARKKVQNRQSATRVRGRKRDELDVNKTQVQKLRAYNAQLQLKNARLETQNTSLKQQLQFMKSLLKNSQAYSDKKPQEKSDQIGQYLNLDVQHSSTEYSSHSFNSINHQSNSKFDSPFEDQEDSLGFMMLPSNNSVGQKNWLFMAVFTIIVAVFVIPQSQANSVIIASQVTGQNQQLLFPWYASAFNIGKNLAKFAIVFVYSAFMFSFIYKKYFKKRGSKGSKSI